MIVLIVNEAQLIVRMLWRKGILSPRTRGNSHCRSRALSGIHMLIIELECRGFNSWNLMTRPEFNEISSNYTSPFPSAPFCTSILLNAIIIRKHWTLCQDTKKRIDRASGNTGANMIRSGNIMDSIMGILGVVTGQLVFIRPEWEDGRTMGGTSNHESNNKPKWITTFWIQNASSVWGLPIGTSAPSIIFSNGIISAWKRFCDDTPDLVDTMWFDAHRIHWSIEW